MYISTLELSHAFLQGLNSIKRYVFMTVLGIIAIFWRELSKYKDFS